MGMRKWREQLFFDALNDAQCGQYGNNVVLTTDSSADSRNRFREAIVDRVFHKHPAPLRVISVLLTIICMYMIFFMWLGNAPETPYSNQFSTKMINAMLMMVVCVSLYNVFILTYKILNFPCANRVMDSWCNGAYRESAWYRELSDDDKANVIAMHTSKAYNIMLKKYHDANRESKHRDMSGIIDVLDTYIANDTELLSENGFLDDPNEARNMISMYREYRDAFKNDERKQRLRQIARGSTDMTIDDEQQLIKAIGEYNTEVELEHMLAPRTKKYESMLRRYREALIHHPEYHAGFPTSQALSDAESLAYAGFTG